MKHKLLCILLCLAMLLTGGLLSGCANNSRGESADTTGDEPFVTRSSMTLTLWVPTSPDTTAEAIEQVEEALNNVTQPMYDTAIKLYALPWDEYDAAVKQQVLDIEQRIKEEEQAELDRRKEELEAAKRGDDETTVPETTERVEEETSPYSLIIPSAPGYPHVEKNQMDIFLIHGMEDYKFYAENFYLSSLNEELSASSKELYRYIYPDFFTAAQVDGTTYGIPNNHAVGEYTYFLVNKRLIEEEYLDPAQITSLDSSQGFIQDVVKYHKDVTPIYGAYVPSYYEYWSGKDLQTFSVLASRITANSDADVPATDVFRNIFSMSNFTNNTYLYKSYVEQGYVATGEEPDEFAVGYIKCSPSEIQKYAKEYYINIHQAPRGTMEDYTQAIFAVSAYTKNVSRSMEILTLLNTNTQFRTILQYGAEGTHWKYDEEDDSFIVPLSDAYQMRILDTGNEFITYPDYGERLSYWDAAKQQNLDSYIPISLLIDAEEYQNEENAALLAKLDAFNAQIKKEIDEMSAETFKEMIDSGTLRQRVENNEAYQKLTYIPKDSDASNGISPETGWDPDASIVNRWIEHFTEVFGRAPGDY